MIGVTGLIIVGSIVAALTTSLVTAIIGVSLAGYGSRSSSCSMAGRIWR